MKRLAINLRVFLVILITVSASLALEAQTADEIIDTYFEVTGGKDKWRSLEGVKMEGKMKMPMRNMEIKMTTVTLKGGKQYSMMNFQGREMKQGVYDGEIMWGTNFMSGKAEEVDSETVSNFKKNEAQDFPHPLLDYEKKGYSVKLLGQENLEGIECHKIQLTKNPVTINGEEKNNIVFFYFDVESSVVTGIESTLPGGGGMMPGRGGQQNSRPIATVSDYQEVEGLYFPFSTSVGPGQMQIDKVILNPELEEDAFAMPKGE